MFEHGTAIETDKRDAGNREFDHQHITRPAGWVVTGCTVDGAHLAIGKCLGVEAGSSFGVLIVPEANRVLCHCESFRFEAKSRLVPHLLAQSLFSSLDVPFALADTVIGSYAACRKSPSCAARARRNAG